MYVLSQPEKVAGIKELQSSAETSESADVFLEHLLRVEVDLLDAYYGVIFYKTGRISCEALSKISQGAEVNWKRAIAKRMPAVLAGGESACEAVPEPPDRLMSGAEFFAVCVPLFENNAAVAMMALVVRVEHQRHLQDRTVMAIGLARYFDLFNLRKTVSALEARYQELSRVFSIFSVATAFRRTDEFVAALANEVKGVLDFERVFFGFEKGGKVKMRQISDEDYFDRKSNLVRAAQMAMTEALERMQTVLYNGPEGNEVAYEGHAALFQEDPKLCTISVPVKDDREGIGVLTCQRSLDRPFGVAEQRFLEVLCGQCGPVIGLTRRAQAGPWGKLAGWWGQALKNVEGGKEKATALLAAVVLVVLLWAVFGRLDFKVKGDCVMRPQVTQYYSAPFGGKLRSVDVLPGDSVTKGEPLFSLDDETATLDCRKEEGELMALEGRLAALYSAGRMDEYNIAQGQKEQVSARLALLKFDIESAVVRAVEGGVVLGPDLSQKLGSTLERGQEMLQVGSHTHLVEIRLSQWDVRYVEAGQEGHFALKAEPARKLPIVIGRIRPTSEAVEKQNVFITEAIVSAPEGIFYKPGMEGAASIAIRRASPIWIFTRKFLHWLRYKLAV